jgi:hypothetical protein
MPVALAGATHDGALSRIWLRSAVVSPVGIRLCLRVFLFCKSVRLFIGFFLASSFLFLAVPAEMK